MSRTKNGFLWTEFETRKILQLYGKYTAREIAAKIGRTEDAVSHQIYRAQAFLKSIEERKRFIESIN